MSICAERDIFGLPVSRESYNPAYKGEGSIIQNQVELLQIAKTASTPIH